MDLTLSAEQAAVRQLAADFADRELVPHAAVWDRRESVDPPSSACSVTWASWG
ncbi:acyl-CoA dehydrogenase family protein [Micromonospora sp. M12]